MIFIIYVLKAFFMTFFYPLLLLLLMLCGNLFATTTTHNVLLIIADDLGIFDIACEDRFTSNETTQTPHINSLCDSGLVFTNLWVNPTCSPTRASILTGRYGFRTGVGAPCGSEENPALSTKELTIPMVLASHNINSAAIGKWHLSDRKDTHFKHPNQLGFDYYSGIYTGGVKNYFNYEKIEQGQRKTSTQYSTTDIVDDAIYWINKQDHSWFLYLAFNAPHTPFHLPPNDLHEYKLSGTKKDINKQPRLYYEAAIEAMDTEIGRLMHALSHQLPYTDIIFMGDNGAPGKVIQPPYNKHTAKASLYQGGIHVPMVIAGPSVHHIADIEPALVNGVDLYATVINLFGLTVPNLLETDSVSLMPYLTNKTQPPLRQFVYSEQFGYQKKNKNGGNRFKQKNQNGYTIRNNNLKIIFFDQQKPICFDMKKDPFEKKNICPISKTDRLYNDYKQLIELLPNK